MKLIRAFACVAVIATLIAAATRVYAQSPSKPNAVHETQTDMNEEADANCREADTELNKVYQQILKRYAKNQLFVTKLRAAQRAWITFRDAHLESEYPIVDKSQYRLEYGSVFPMCYASSKTNLTQECTQQLKAWLAPREEGDVCSGSYGATE